MDGKAACDTCAGTEAETLNICDECVDRANDEVDVLKAQLAAVTAERDALDRSYHEMYAQREDYRKQAHSAYAERDAFRARLAEVERERDGHAAALKNLSDYCYALESTAEDARTCAEYVLSDEFADDYESIAEAASRVLGQLPPRPVLDLDDVRMVCEWIAEWPDAESHQLAARRVLAALAKMGGE